MHCPIPLTVQYVQTEPTSRIYFIACYEVLPFPTTYTLYLPMSLAGTMMTSSYCSSTTPASPSSADGLHQPQQQQQQQRSSSTWRCIVFVVLFPIAFFFAALPYWSHNIGSSSSSSSSSLRGGNDDSPSSTSALRLSNRHNHHPAAPEPRQRRRRLILHVGPSKSATTSLQTDLTALQSALREDNYAYAGRYYAPFVHPKTGEYKLGRDESPLLVTAHNMLKHCDRHGGGERYQCCIGFARELDAYARRHRWVGGVILSEEPFGNQWRRTEDWRAIQRALLMAGGGGDENSTTANFKWEVTVVIGYR